MFESITERLGDIFRKLRRKAKLSRKDVEKGLREIRLALLEADVNYRVVKSFIERLEGTATGERVLKSFTPGDALRKVVYEELRDFLADSETREIQADGKPGIIMLMGLQGSGKTTTAVKIGHLLRKKGKECLLVPCDLKRPAAIEQLRIMAEREHLPFYEIQEKTALAIAENGVRHARERGLSTVILDTAGRLHIDDEMVKELAQLQQALHPGEILLVLDAMTGQDAVTIGLEFQKQVDFNGIVLTKMDGDARGGAALSLRFVTQRPIKLVGTGEKPDDLEFFHADRMASRILGMGDLSALAEKAAEIIEKEEAEEAARKLREDRFTLEDFRKQVRSIRKLGSLDKIIGMMPGMKSLRGMKVDDGSIDRIEAMINSMTPEERENPKVINGSRRKRIARGSGTSVSEINKLLKDFEAMRKMMRQFTRGKPAVPPGFQLPTG